MDSIERKSPQPLEIFYCYARKDRELRDELDTHLSGLHRLDLIKIWYDGEISPGVDWEEAIKTHLESARIILLLVSADFLKSDYCYSTEMTRALERHRANTARVVPILLRSCDWQDAPFASLQMLPADALPVTRWSDHDAAFDNIARGIRQVVNELLAPGAGDAAPTVPPAKRLAQTGSSNKKSNEKPLPRTPDRPASTLNSPRLIQSRSTEPVQAHKEAVSDPSFDPHTADLATVYLNALKAHEYGDVQEAVRLLQILTRRNSKFQSEKILPLLETDLWKLAELSALAGEWKQEMETLRALNSFFTSSAVESSSRYPFEKRWRAKKRIEELLEIAQQNQTYAGTYADAHNFLQTGDATSARQRLTLIRENAPYYGDPAALAEQVGMPVFDRKTIAQTQERSDFISKPPPRGIETAPIWIWLSACAFLLGLGTAIGVLTRSWLWAGGVSILLIIAMTLLRPYRVINLLTTIGVFLISIALVCTIAWYASTLNYNQAQTSDLWFIGQRVLWLNRQIYLGLASGALIGFIMLITLLASDGEFPIWLLPLPFALLWLLATYFNWGFGYGAGWPFALSACLIGYIGAVGLVQIGWICIKYGQYLATRSERTWYR